MAWLWAALFFGGTIAMLLMQGGDAALASMISGAGGAVTLCLELAGGYLLFMGLMGVARRAGLLEALTKRLGGMTRRLFPHAGAAAGAISLAMAANILGLGNAATPLGLAAMRELDRVNPANGVATDEMCAFVAVNASMVQLLPTGLIALRSAAGSAEPASVVLPSLIASAAGTVTAVALCRALTRR